MNPDKAKPTTEEKPHIVFHPKPVDRHWVFVYGTLKKGMSNHTALERSLFLGNSTLFGYKMRHCGSYPAIFKAPMAEISPSRVYGEVYEITQQTLADLDKIEGVPTLYKRDLVDVGLWKNVYVYTQMAPTYECRVIKTGNWIGDTRTDSEWLKMEHVFADQLPQQRPPLVRALPAFPRIEPQVPAGINAAVLLWGAPEEYKVDRGDPPEPEGRDWNPLNLTDKSAFRQNGHSYACECVMCQTLDYRMAEMGIDPEGEWAELT